MYHQIKQTLSRTNATLVSDAIGAAALVVMLFVGLTLPGLS